MRVSEAIGVGSESHIFPLNGDTNTLYSETGFEKSKILRFPKLSILKRLVQADEASSAVPFKTFSILKSV